MQVLHEDFEVADWGPLQQPTHLTPQTRRRLLSITAALRAEHAEAFASLGGGDGGGGFDGPESEGLDAPPLFERDYDSAEDLEDSAGRDGSGPDDSNNGGGRADDVDGEDDRIEVLSDEEPTNNNNRRTVTLQAGRLGLSIAPDKDGRAQVKKATLQAAEQGVEAGDYIVAVEGKVLPDKISQDGLVQALTSAQRPFVAIL